MRLLLIHSDGFAFQTKNKVPGATAEDVPDDEHEFRIDTYILVVYITVEKKDEQDMEKAVELAVQEIENYARELDEVRVMVYPYAHISTSLGSSKAAIKILNDIKENLQNDGFEAYKSPFGWYKSFQLNCLGHPRAESLRSIDVETAVV